MNAAAAVLWTAAAFMLGYGPAYCLTVALRQRRDRRQLARTPQPRAHVEWLAAGQQLATRCTCDPVPLSCNGEGPSETCEIHGRAYAEWVERGDILNARLEAVKEVIAKARATPVANDPFRVALDIADELEAAVYLEPGVWPPDHGKVIADLRAALTGEPVECCASGRCEVCTPGYVW